MSDVVCVPTDVRPLLGLPPLTSYDDPTGYDALLAWVAEDVQPRGAGEWMLVKEVADLAWDALRLRRAYALAVEDARARAERVCRQEACDEAMNAGPRPTDEQLVGLEPMPDDWPPEVEPEEKAVALRAMRFGLCPWERLGRRIAEVEDRREKALFAIEKRRLLIGLRLRAATQPAVIDARFAEVPA